MATGGWWTRFSSWVREQFWRAVRSLDPIEDGDGPERLEDVDENYYGEPRDENHGR